MKQRLLHIDVIRGLCIFTVVYVHVIGFGMPVSYPQTSIQVFLSSFFLIMFYFISGMMSYREGMLINTRSLGEYLWKKIRTLLQRQLQPEARGDILTRLRENNIHPTAMMDISDGLSSELMHICKQSNCGCRIYEKNIPIDYQTAVMAEELNMNVTTCALNGGEDYELLFTVPIGDHEKIEAMEGVKLIGHITKPELGQMLVTYDNNEFELKAQGWNPLR